MTPRLLITFCASVIWASLGPFALSIAAAGCGSSTSPSGTDFVNNQVYLLPYQDPASSIEVTGKGYNPPGCSTHIGSSSQYAGALISAFNAAPQSFQAELCNLTCVFISQCENSAKCTSGDLTTGSWGYRERPDQHPGTGRFVAMSAGFWDPQLWPSGSAPPSLHEFETVLVSALIGWPAGDNPPTYGPFPNDSSTMTVIAALAHEFGHVLWYDTFRPMRGKSFDFLTFCRGSFFDNSWQRVNAPPTWRNFGDVQDSHHIYDPAIADIALAVNRKNYKQAAKLLDQIYRARAPWPSLFGAFSPDEDFVESFKLYTLINATPALVSLPINIYDNSSAGMTTSTYTEDIPSALSARKNQKGELRRKLDCMDALGNPP